MDSPVGSALIPLLSGVASAYNPGIARGVGAIYSTLGYLDERKERTRLRQKLADQDSAEANMRKTALAAFASPDENANPADPSNNDGAPTGAEATSTALLGGRGGAGGRINSMLKAEGRGAGVSGGAMPTPHTPSKLIGVPTTQGQLSPRLRAFLQAEAQVDPRKAMQDYQSFTNQGTTPQLPSLEDAQRAALEKALPGSEVSGIPLAGGGTYSYKQPWPEGPDKPEKPTKPSIEVKQIADGEGNTQLVVLKDGELSKTYSFKSKGPPGEKPAMSAGQLANLRIDAAKAIASDPGRKLTAGPPTKEEVNSYISGTLGIDSNTGVQMGPPDASPDARPASAHGAPARPSASAPAHGKKKFRFVPGQGIVPK